MIRILSVGSLLSGSLLWGSGMVYAVPFKLQDNGFKGLEQANEHGQKKGHDNAAFHQQISFPQNASFRTEQGGLKHSTMGGAALNSPTTVPSSTSQAASVPEPTSLLLLGSAFAGLRIWHLRNRKEWNCR